MASSLSSLIRQITIETDSYGWRDKKYVTVEFNSGNVVLMIPDAGFGTPQQQAERFAHEVALEVASVIEKHVLDIVDPNKKASQPPAATSNKLGMSGAPVYTAVNPGPAYQSFQNVPWIDAKAEEERRRKREYDLKVEMLKNMAFNSFPLPVPAKPAPSKPVTYACPLCVKTFTSNVPGVSDHIRKDHPKVPKSFLDDWIKSNK